MAFRTTLGAYAESVGLAAVAMMTRGRRTDIAASPASAVLVHAARNPAEATLRLVRHASRSQVTGAATRHAALACVRAHVDETVYRTLVAVPEEHPAA